MNGTKEILTLTLGCGAIKSYIILPFVEFSFATVGF